MTRQVLLQQTIDNLAKLPDQNLQEVADFAEFLLSKLEDRLLTERIQKLVMNSNSFQFLEEDLYTEADLKEMYM